MLKFEIYSCNQIDSTNLEAKRLIQSGNQDNLIIIAQQQTHGRGRDGRLWVSDIGNLYMTLAVHLQIPITQRSDFCFITGLTVLNSIVKQPHNNISLKWPNDIMINDAKVAGILVESLDNFLIIGIGVNIVSSPETLGRITTNLHKENIVITPEKLMQNIVKNFEKYYLLWQAQGFEFIRQRWLKHAYKLNREINFHYNEQIITGIFKGIDDTGNILIEDTSCSIKRFGIGEN